MNHDAYAAMHLFAFTDRLAASGLSRWELGDLLGVHPHQLGDDELKDLRDLPVRVLIELARHLDMHPADLVYELDAVLSNRRAPAVANPFAPPGPDDEAADTDPQADAITVLVALATAPTPLTADALTHALGWRLPRTHAALRHLHDHPRLGGPMALRRAPRTPTPSPHDSTSWTASSTRRSPNPACTATSSPKPTPPPCTP